MNRLPNKSSVDAEVRKLSLVRCNSIRAASVQAKAAPSKPIVLREALLSHYSLFFKIRKGLISEESVQLTLFKRQFSSLQSTCKTIHR